MLTHQRLQAWAQSMEPTIAPSSPIHIGRLVASDGMILAATGFPYPVGTQAQIATQNGPPMRVEVIGFRDGAAVLTRLCGASSVTMGADVIPCFQNPDVACGDAYLGRVINALGAPLDGKALPRADEYWPISGKAVPPLSRSSVREPLDCGVRAINALLTLGVGQRAAIIAGSGVGKSVLLGQMLAGAISAQVNSGAVDRIVIGLIGERGREINDFLDHQLSPHVRAKSVVIAAPADDPALLRLRAAHRATAMAEAFRAAGHHVLLIIDSLTRVAHAQREIGLALGEPAAMKAYPPSVFALIPALAERAGRDARSGGAITALYTVLADGDDVQDPIVDTVRAIVDGHIILSRQLAEAQVYPAIDIGQSISRVMTDIVSPDHTQAARQYRQMWALYAENRDLVTMGAWRPGADVMLDAAIGARAAMLDFLCQPPGQPIEMASSVSDLSLLCTENFGTCT